MSTISHTLVTEIASKLNSRDTPPVKDGIHYRILVFKAKTPEKWVVAMIPDFIMVEDLFVAVNESYGLFLAGEQTPCGMVFMTSDLPGNLVTLASEWFNDLQLTPPFD